MTASSVLTKSAMRRAGIAASLMAAALVPLPATPSADFTSAAFTDQRPYLWERAVPDDTLDGIRGGILLSEGYIIDFSIAVTTTIDGVVVQSTLATDFIEDLASVTNQGSLIQLGEGNSLPPELEDELSGFVTVIQNTQEGAVINQTLDADIDVNDFDMQRLINSNTLRSVIETTTIR